MLNDGNHRRLVIGQFGWAQKGSFCAIAPGYLDDFGIVGADKNPMEEVLGGQRRLDGVSDERFSAD